MTESIVRVPAALKEKKARPLQSSCDHDLVAPMELGAQAQD